MQNATGFGTTASFKMYPINDRKKNIEKLDLCTRVS